MLKVAKVSATLDEGRTITEFTDINTSNKGGKMFMLNLHTCIITP